jgi:hypothetical protein
MTEHTTGLDIMPKTYTYWFESLEDAKSFVECEERKLNGYLS